MNRSEAVLGRAVARCLVCVSSRVHTLADAAVVVLSGVLSGGVVVDQRSLVAEKIIDELNDPQARRLAPLAFGLGSMC